MSEIAPTAAPTKADKAQARAEARAARAQQKAEGRKRGARGAREGRGPRVAATPVLGVQVTPQALYGVLLRATGDGFEPVRQFSRQRAAGEAGPAPELAGLGPAFGGTPDMAAPDDGVTIKFGDGAGADLFLDSEFAQLGASAAPGAEAAFDTAKAPTKAAPVVFELKDLVEECRAAGFERPALSFCIGAPDVDYVEVIVPAEAAKGEGAKGKKKAKKEAEAPPATNGATEASTHAPVKRERLLALLPKGDAAYDKERVAFIPMTPRDRLRRYLAVLPRPEEPVAPSLELLREQQGMRRLHFRALDAEVPILVGLARLAGSAEPHENTAIVRVGVEDTLVILLAGNQLHHCDHMRSVTTFDGPDTICSRVLLQQDVQGVGTVHNVVIVSEEREEELVQGFAAFYPEARVETLRAGLARIGIAGPYGPLPTPAMIATGVALKALLRKDSVFEDTNLLPKNLRRRTVGGPRVELGVSWHTAVVGALLFLTVLFFVGLYFAQGRQIAEAERRLAELPPQATMSGEQLQARIDSLRGVHQRITQSLRVMDSLLVGSDRWTQTLATTTRAAAAVGGVWVEEWTPTDAALELKGYATGRDRVVSLAQRLNGSIEEVTFQAIREASVFQYRVKMGLPNEMPAVATYLRERARQQAAAEAQAGQTPEPLADEVSLE